MFDVEGPLDIFVLVTGWWPSAGNGSACEKRAVRIFNRHLEIGSACVALLAQGRERVTAMDISEYLEGRIDPESIEDYLCNDRHVAYIEATQHFPDLYERGLSWLLQQEG